MPDAAAAVVDACVPGRDPRSCSPALDASVAGDIEGAFAAAGHIVVSNARNFRMDPLVPLLIPEVNADHLSLLAEQRRAKGWTGAIVTNPNCSTIVLAMALAPLRPFDIRAVIVSTMQAVSGAGYPGVPSLDILGNVVPFIGGEEEKMRDRDAEDSRRRRRPVAASGRDQRAHQPRAGDRRSHDDGVGGVRAASPTRRGDRRGDAHVPRPAAGAARCRPRPTRPIVVMEDTNRPQPRLDADLGGGMAVTVGRLRAVSGAARQVRRARPQYDSRRGRRWRS